MQKIVHALSECFLDLPIYNAAKFYNLVIISYDSDRITNTEMCLTRVLLEFQYTEEESDMCKGELLEFMERLRHECENKTMAHMW